MDFDKWIGTAIPEHMKKRGLIIYEENMKPIRILFEQRQVPEDGWSDDLIRMLLKFLAFMDTDKDSIAARIGEREARVASPLIDELASGFCHGVGRSGMLTDPQPKAPGGSIMYYLANQLATDALKKFGLPNIKKAFVAPLGTGMGLTLALAAARRLSKRNEVIYPRVDHRSPMKAIELAGLEKKVIEGEVVGDAVKVPISEIEKAITEKTAVIVSTTTFFPPREPDDIKAIAKIAEKKNIFHVVNNAYGVQSIEIMKIIQGAIDAGRVDAIIQSTDKNFLCPMGGSIIASPNLEFLENISMSYVGRATAAPIVQFLAAILSLGAKKYERLRTEQMRCRKLLEDLIKPVAKKHGERLLKVFNPIAIAISITEPRDPRKIAADLYNLRVTGPRGLRPTDFGVCCPKYTTGYLTINAAIGVTEGDIQKAVKRVDEVLSKR